MTFFDVGALFLRRVEEKIKIVPSRRMNVAALPEQNPPEDKASNTARSAETVTPTDFRIVSSQETTRPLGLISAPDHSGST